VKGIMYLSAPFVFGAMQKWPWIRRPGVIFGLLLMCTALAASSFAKTVPQLIVTQGILYAIGGGIAYAPTILFMNEWFVRRRGLAFGVMWVRQSISPLLLLQSANALNRQAQA
jgi:MFS family permease